MGRTATTSSAAVSACWPASRSFLAGLSGILAALGLVGVANVLVARRTREIAVRLALGVSRVRIARRVLGEVSALALAGGAIGLAIFLASNRVFQSPVFEISADDPLAIGVAVFALMAAACLAGTWPARRAARLDPAVTLRVESRNIGIFDLLVFKALSLDPERAIAGRHHS